VVDMKAKVREWGGSLGIVIPNEIAEIKGIRAGDEVLAEIRKISNLGEVFGSLSGWARSTQLIKDEARKGWDRKCSSTHTRSSR
jgi:bifunctional DNA-binding transcriptional regulator/antitoxin component of YhaV-PrlF toxin-antitoxin module